MLRAGCTAVLAAPPSFSARERPAVKQGAQDALDAIDQFVMARQRGDLNAAAVHAYLAGRSAQAIFDLDDRRDERNESRPARTSRFSARDADILAQVRARVIERAGKESGQDLFDRMKPGVSRTVFFRLLTRANFKKMRAAARAKAANDASR